MLRRCYSAASLERYPTYTGCTVCKNWLSLAKFQEWFDNNYVEGHHLDKDIIKPGNKIYGPQFCCFISPALNAILVDHKGAQGPYPTGVCKCENTFMVQCCYRGRQKTIGRFDTPEMAEIAYLTFKSAYLLEIAEEQTDVRLSRGLRLHARLKSDEA